MGHPNSNEDYNMKRKRKNRIKNDYCYEDIDEKYESQQLNNYKNIDINDLYKE